MKMVRSVPIILLIDDERIIHEFIQNVVQEMGIRLSSAMSAEEGVATFSREQPDVVILDVGLPDLSGLDTFRQLQKIDARVPVIFVTGAGTTATAIDAMSLGAFEYVLKPLEYNSLIELIKRAIEVARLMNLPALLTESADAQAPADSLVGRSPSMHQVYKSIGRVAPHNITVLILGESGTGKELVARAIYQHSHRNKSPFLAINCSAIPEPLLESELFGHEQGAFTGADKKRIGKFEQCNGGTLFLDEVGDMTPLTQTKILRLVQEQRFERVGGNESIQTNVRLIAATNRNLEKLVADGKFRQDLFYRLSVFAIKLPALRERPEDLPTLVSYFLRRYALEMNKSVNGLASATLDVLKKHSWPGNIRELQSVIQHAILVASGSIIVPEFLPDSLRLEALAKIDTPSIMPTAFHDLDQFVAERLMQGTCDLYSQWQNVTELRLFQMVLNHTDGNISKASKALGIHRATLRSKIGALGLDADERRPVSEELKN